MAFVLAGLTACTGQYTQTHELGDIAMSVTTQPYPLTVGKETEVYVTLRQSRAGVAGCQVKFRQFEAGMVPAAEEGFVAMPETRAGVYRALSAPFERSGQHKLEFRLECPERLPATTEVFEYVVESGT